MAKKAEKTPSNRLAAINTAIKLMTKYCPDFQCEPARGSPKTPSRRIYEIRPKARRLTHDCQIQARRNNPNFKCELGLRIGVHFLVENMEIHQKRGTCRCTYTGMSTTSQTNTRTAPVVATTGISPPCPKLDAKMNLHNRDIDHEEVLQLRNLRSFQTSGPRQLSLHNDGHGNDSVVAQRRNCGSSTVSFTTAPNTARPANPNIDHLVNALQLKNPNVLIKGKNHRNLHLRHDGDVDDLDTRTVHHVAQ